MPIRYKSTRGKQTGLSFEEVVLGGLATDKGLYLPETIPTFTKEKIESMRSMSYSDLAFEVISSFVTDEDIPAGKLKDIVNRSFSTFRVPEVTPLVKLPDYWVLELFHGPTYAFKDVALQFLGNVFEHFLQEGRIQKSITILGATSGDTGSAAIYGLRGKDNVNCFIMYPLGKVTDIQERQMTSILDDNVHCISVKGDFDDCQAIVKAAFADADFKDEVKLGAINSINWARVLAQITYYYYSYLRVTDSVGDKSKCPSINFAVPTGNFGDILAGFMAKKMGLAIDKLVVCTNENDVLHRFFNTGVYEKSPAIITISPSMDISISSNFERYLYYLAGENSATLKSWMDQFESTGRMAVSADLHNMANTDFLSFASNKSQILKTMTDLYAAENYLVCPHTATAVVGVNALKLPSETTVILATAHPAKFEEAIQLSLTAAGLKVPPRPDTLEALFSMPTRKTLLSNSLPDVQAYVRTKLSLSSGNTNGASAKGASNGVLGKYFTLPNVLTAAAGLALVAFAVVKMKK
jgi:threonine synthase